MPASRTVYIRALENLDDCVMQTIEALSETDNPETAADLSTQLNNLDTGKILVADLLSRTGTSTHI